MGFVWDRWAKNEWRFGAARVWMVGQTFLSALLHLRHARPCEPGYGISRRWRCLCERREA